MILETNRRLVFTSQAGNNLRIIPWIGLQIAYVSGPQRAQLQSLITGPVLTKWVRNAVTCNETHREEGESKHKHLIHSHMYPSKYATRAYIHGYTHIHTYIRVYTYIYTICIYIYIPMHALYIYIHIHTCRHTHTYLHELKHTHKYPRMPHTNMFHANAIVHIFTHLPNQYNSCNISYKLKRGTEEGTHTRARLALHRRRLWRRGRRPRRMSMECPRRVERPRLADGGNRVPVGPNGNGEKRTMAMG